MTGILLLADGLSPSNDQARQWVRDEYADDRYRPEAPQPPAEPSWWQRFLDWLDERFFDVLFPPDGGASVEGVLAIIVGVLLAAAIGWYLFRLIRRAGPRTGQDSTDDAEAVLPPDPHPADGYRNRAAAARDAADFNASVIEAMRAIARRADERALIAAARTSTAHEIALRLGTPFPQFADDLAWAADLFDAVVYGGRHADADSAQRILGLEAALAKAKPLKTTDPEDTEEDSGAIAPQVVST